MFVLLGFAVCGLLSRWTLCWKWELIDIYHHHYYLKGAVLRRAPHLHGRSVAMAAAAGASSMGGTTLPLVAMAAAGGGPPSMEGHPALLSPLRSDGDGRSCQWQEREEIAEESSRVASRRRVR